MVRPDRAFNFCENKGVSYEHETSWMDRRGGRYWPGTVSQICAGPRLSAAQPKTPALETGGFFAFF